MGTRSTVWLTVALLLGLALPLSAMDDSAVVGTWLMTVETPRGTNEITLEFVSAEGGLSGNWSGTRGSGELLNVEWDGKTLRFRREVSGGERTFTLDYEATIDGDTMQGKMATPRGERPFEARRQSAEG